MKDQLQNETKHKLATQTRVRQLEDELAESLEFREELEFKKADFETVCNLFF